MAFFLDRKINSNPTISDKEVKAHARGTCVTSTYSNMPTSKNLWYSIFEGYMLCLLPADKESLSDEMRSGSRNRKVMLRTNWRRVNHSVQSPQGYHGLGCQKC